MRRLSLAVLLLLPLTALAAEMDVRVDIPQLNVSEYHRPYVAVWVEDGNRQVVANLAVWYDVHNPKNEGAKWLNDLRQWWRRAGRSMTLPVDGVTGATRPVGQHQLHFVAGQAPLGELKPGEHTLVVEAAREVGGREMLRLPFQWPGDASQHLQVEGNNELERVVLDINP